MAVGGDEGLDGWFGAMFDGPDVEDASTHERDDEGEAPPVFEEDHEGCRADGEERAGDVQKVADPVNIRKLKFAILLQRLRLFPQLPHSPLDPVNLHDPNIKRYIQTPLSIQLLQVFKCQRILDHMLHIEVIHVHRRYVGEPSGRVLLVEVLASLLVVKTRGEDERIKPRGAPVEGGAARDGVEVGEGEETAGGEFEVGDGCGGPAVNKSSGDDGLDDGLVCCCWGLELIRTSMRVELQ